MIIHTVMTSQKHIATTITIRVVEYDTHAYSKATMVTFLNISPYNHNNSNNIEIMRKLYNAIL